MNLISDLNLSLLTDSYSTHLNERPIRSDDLDDHHHGDADHGGQGQGPTYADSPVRILIDLVVLQWLVFDQGEDKAALRERKRDISDDGIHVKRYKVQEV